MQGSGFETRTPKKKHILEKICHLTKNAPKRGLIIGHITRTRGGAELESYFSPIIIFRFVKIMFFFKQRKFIETTLTQIQSVSKEEATSNIQNTAITL